MAAQPSRAGAGVGIASHRAGYGVGLAKVSQGLALENITGRIAYGVQKVCGGWIQTQSGTMNLHLPDGRAVAQVMHYSAWESDDGDRYRFSVKTEGLSEDTVLGEASVRPGQGGRAVFSMPEKTEFVLPADTLFPMAHTKFMIEAARAGKSQVRGSIFEGTELEGAKLLVVFISPLSTRAAGILSSFGEELRGMKGWNFRLAYFDPSSRDGKPLYEVEADVLENGVAPRWLLDYGDYVVEMKLSKLEFLAKPECE